MFVQLTLRAGGDVFVKIDAIIAIRPFTGGQSDVYVPGHLFLTTASPADLRAVLTGRPQAVLTVLHQ